MEGHGFIMNTTANHSTMLVDHCNTLDKHRWLEAKLVLISILGTIVGVFGVFGNITTVLILTRPKMRTPNNLFLTALAVYDTCVLVTAFMLYAIEYIIEYAEIYSLYMAWLAYLRVTFALSNTAQTGSVYITVAVTVERFLAVVLPNYAKLMCHNRGAAVSIVIVSVFAVVFNCTKYFEVVVVRDRECQSGTWNAYVLNPGAIAFNDLYQTVYSLWLSNIVMVFLPFIFLFVGNTAIAWTIRKSVKRLRNTERKKSATEIKEKSREATLVLVVIVFIFLVCNFWGFVLALLEHVFIGSHILTSKYPKFYTFSREAINFLAIVNSSINFVIYCIFGKDFREQVVTVYGCVGTIMMPTNEFLAPWRQDQRSTGGSYESISQQQHQLDGIRQEQLNGRLPPCTCDNDQTAVSALIDSPTTTTTPNQQQQQQQLQQQHNNINHNHHVRINETIDTNQIEYNQLNINYQTGHDAQQHDQQQPQQQQQQHYPTATLVSTASQQQPQIVYTTLDINETNDEVLFV